MQARTRTALVFCLGIAMMAAAFQASTAETEGSVIDTAPADPAAPIATNIGVAAKPSPLQVALGKAPDSLEGLNSLFQSADDYQGSDARSLSLGLTGRTEPAGPDERFGIALSSEESGGALTSAFANRQQFGPQLQDESGRKPLNMSLSVAASVIPRALDFGFAQRTSVVDGDGGQFLSRGAEVRLGQRLEGLISEKGGSTWDKLSWYFFAASDDQALAWTPADPGAGSRGSLALQDRVDIGDVQAGVTIEAAGVQGSIAYLERETSNGRIGSGDRTRSETERYVGATLTVRR